jgi:hypothetical protein
MARDWRHFELRSRFMGLHRRLAAWKSMIAAN